MKYWIDQLGFWGYMRQFPINPITIITFAVLIGLVVLFINAAVRRRKANAFLSQNLGAAVMTFHKKQVGNADYADNIRIVTLNGQQAPWFFLQPAVPALYLQAGENTLEVYAEWARGGTSIRMYSSHMVALQVNAQLEGHYSLEYYIPENRYIFAPYDNPKLFHKA